MPSCRAHHEGGTVVGEGVLPLASGTRVAASTGVAGLTVTLCWCLCTDYVSACDLPARVGAVCQGLNPGGGTLWASMEGRRCHLIAWQLLLATWNLPPCLLPRATAPLAGTYREPAGSGVDPDGKGRCWCCKCALVCSSGMGCQWCLGCCQAHPRHVYRVAVYCRGKLAPARAHMLRQAIRQRVNERGWRSFSRV
jgi:hypothetical protein